VLVRLGLGKLIDVGDRNEGLKKSLSDLASLNQISQQVRFSWETP
jgi:hypothetical protein